MYVGIYWNAFANEYFQLNNSLKRFSSTDLNIIYSTGLCNQIHTFKYIITTCSLWMSFADFIALSPIYPTIWPVLAHIAFCYSWCVCVLFALFYIRSVCTNFVPIVFAVIYWISIGNKPETKTNAVFTLPIYSAMHTHCVPRPVVAIGVCLFFWGLINFRNTSIRDPFLLLLLLL